MVDAIVHGRTDIVHAWIRTVERKKGRNSVEKLVNQHVELTRHNRKEKRTLLQWAFILDRLDITVLLAQHGAHVDEQLVTTRVRIANHITLSGMI